MTQPHFTQAEHAALYVYLRRIFDLVGLKDWQLELRGDPIPVDGEGLATCQCPDGRQLAKVQFGADWRNDFDGNPHEFRDTCVHEAMHALLWATMQSPHLLEGQVAPQVWDTFDTVYMHHLEIAVDRIAHAWSQTLPLPPTRADVAAIERLIAEEGPMTVGDLVERARFARFLPKA